MLGPHKTQVLLLNLIQGNLPMAFQKVVEAVAIIIKIVRVLSQRIKRANLWPNRRINLFTLQKGTLSHQ